MIHPIPNGTRDVLPDEMRELRAITEAMRGVFEQRGYGEVWTPTLEFEEVLRRGETGVDPAYRVFDDHGHVMALRPDMTVPIARVVATRYAHAEPPLRFSYFAHAYRGVRPHRGQMREFLQAGIELVGAPGPHGTVEALTVLCEALDAVGLVGYRIALGNAALYPALLETFGVPDDGPRACCSARWPRATSSAWSARWPAAGCDAALLRVPQLRGGPEVLDEITGGEADGLRAIFTDLPDARRAADRLRPRPRARPRLLHRRRSSTCSTPRSASRWAAAGATTTCSGASGGRCPPCGFALHVDRLHLALAGEEAVAA